MLQNPPPLKPLPNAILAYTDGACRQNPNGKGGFGVVMIFPNGHQMDICGGNENTTNNRMELMAAIVALQHSSADIPLDIWTDSIYVQKGITEWIANWKRKNWQNVKNPDLWQQLDQLCQHRVIAWHWVKGHAGHMGNEYADRLANQGIDNLPNPFSITHHQITPPMTKQIPINDDLEQLFFLDPQMDTQIDIDEDSETIANPFTNKSGIYIAQDDNLINQRPLFDGKTNHSNKSFIPLLPIAKNTGVNNRQLILDTETTGLNALNGDRIIEIGVIEIINRRFTGEKLHVYLNPEREMSEDAVKVHGITSEFLQDMPTFAQVAQVVYDFLKGAEIIAHNATFDMSFLQAEFERFGLADFSQQISVIDSLEIAKQMYPAQKNSLDALVKRLNVGKKDRTFHGALLDAEILTEVYLTMTGGQVAMDMGFDNTIAGHHQAIEHRHFSNEVKRYLANADSEQQHLAWLHHFNGNKILQQNWGNSST